MGVKGDSGSAPLYQECRADRERVYGLIGFAIYRGCLKACPGRDKLNDISCASSDCLGGSLGGALWVVRTVFVRAGIRSEPFTDTL